MKRIWIDLTDLYIWKGHFTGIQRVTFNYALRFHAQGARFFVYSSLYEKFVEIDFSAFKEMKKAEAREDVHLTQRQKIKKNLKHKYALLPRFIQLLLRPALSRANKVFRKIAAYVLDHQNIEKTLRNLPEVEFKKSDIVLLLGAGWNSGDLIKRLAEKKEQLNYQIITHLNDILPIYEPQLFAEELPQMFTKYTHQALEISDKVTVISQATKQDVVRYCKEHKIKTPEITVIRLGEDIAAVKSERPDVKLSNKFILCVGTFEIRKNYSLLYQALKLAQTENIQLPQIVIAGRRGWLAGDLYYTITHDPLVKDKLVLLENISDENLSWLYDNCLFTVFCSVAEGWGLPIAESLQHGKFCIASNTSSMPEIAGDSIDYFNPYDTRECMNKIALHSKKGDLELHQDIRNNYRAFTWDESFQQISNFVSESQQQNH